MSFTRQRGCSLPILLLSSLLFLTARSQCPHPQPIDQVADWFKSEVFPISNSAANNAKTLIKHTRNASSIRLSLRPVITLTDDTRAEHMDAGICITHSSLASGLACLPSLIIMGVMKGDQRGFESGWRKYALLGFEMDSFANVSHSMAFAILERGFYAEQLDVITQYYPRDQIHLNLYEAMSKDMVSHINDIQTWLGLPFFDYSPLTRINARGYVSLQAVKSKTDSKPYESLGDDVYQLLVEMYLPSMRDLARYIDKSLLRKHWHIN
ncbi:uncharacterized protein MONBRDRAFT_10368 [Monosiga brevicollis MX1]|uniref:Sulfotransferase domain-containing protein n=1 Tax=Monosiga brevicollis TaxID=81824 RepID=A9V604_MONBE|nr:uncharacterized protein MONBRDRAFT_10368 [Monosiga brevicollis MX1]EDQ86988.1 predicted protein [Monosiga brevicollis MX1]|eukprot:XP_001748227.1 hypothetical protein [Monosiga brevicollis MX1]